MAQLGNAPEKKDEKDDEIFYPDIHPRMPDIQKRKLWVKRNKREKAKGTYKQHVVFTKLKELLHMFE